MMRCVTAFVWLAMFSVASLAAAPACDSGARYVQKIVLPSGQTVVIAEGDCEARSLGSYSVRLYKAGGAQPGDDTTLYAAGVILERDGTIEAVRLADLDGNGRDELVVVIRSVGSGGYLSAQALSVANNHIEVRSSVKGLPKDADPIAALTKTSHADKVTGKGKYHDPVGGAR